MKRETLFTAAALLWFAFSMVLMSVTTGDFDRLVKLLKAGFIGE